MAKANLHSLKVIQTTGNNLLVYLKMECFMEMELCFMLTETNAQEHGNIMNKSVKVGNTCYHYSQNMSIQSSTLLMLLLTLTLLLFIGVYTWANNIQAKITFNQGNMFFE